MRVLSYVIFLKWCGTKNILWGITIVSGIIQKFFHRCPKNCFNYVDYCSGRKEKGSIHIYFKLSTLSYTIIKLKVLFLERHNLRNYWFKLSKIYCIGKIMVHCNCIQSYLGHLYNIHMHYVFFLTKYVYTITKNTFCYIHCTKKKWYYHLFSWK